MFSKPVITLLDSELGCLCQESPEFLFTESQDENLFLHMETAISGQLTQWLYISSFQLLSHVHLFAAPWTAARQASLYITSSQSLLKLMFIELVVSSNHFILCCPLLLLPSIFPSIRAFQMSQLFTSGGRSIGISASTSLLPMNTQG